MLVWGFVFYVLIKTFDHEFRIGNLRENLIGFKWFDTFSFYYGDESQISGLGFTFILLEKNYNKKSKILQ